MSVEVVQEPALLRSRQIPDYPLRYCSFTEDSSVIVACGYSHTEALAVDNGELLGSWPQGFRRCRGRGYAPFDRPHSQHRR